MKNFWKLILKNVAVSLITWILLLGIILLLISSTRVLWDKPTPIKPKSILVFNLSTNITDAPPKAAPQLLLSKMLKEDLSTSLYLLEVREALEHALVDDRIVGIFLHGSLQPIDYGSGMPVLREIGEGLAALKKAGKPVIAYLTNPHLQDYFLASNADVIVLNPLSILPLNGLAAERLFLGNALKKYGIGVQTTRVGSYKTATDMFTSDHMSEKDREQLDAVLQTLWNELLLQVSHERNVEMPKLLSLVETEGILSAQEALRAGLIDKVGYLDEVIEDLKILGSHDPSIDSFTQVDLTDYIAEASVIASQRRQGQPSQGDTLAVVYAEGNIVDGEGAPGQVGADRLARELRSLRHDENVKAVVLRVNSPGGSAVAAEKIGRAMQLLSESKTTVVSMGTVAASGGYWIAAPAQVIFAQPETLTGSIGVWGLLVNFKSIGENYGITWDGVKTAPFADINTFSRPKTQDELNLIQRYTDLLYSDFLQKVADGRGMSIQSVKTLAEGRIWSGLAAQQNGLVDAIGGLETALAYAAKLAGLTENWDLIQIPEKRTLSEAFAEMWSEGYRIPVAKLDPLSRELYRLQNELPSLRDFTAPYGAYARLPFNLMIH